MSNIPFANRKFRLLIKKTKINIYSEFIQQKMFAAMQNKNPTNWMCKLWKFLIKFTEAFI